MLGRFWDRLSLERLIHKKRHVLGYVELRVLGLESRVWGFEFRENPCLHNYDARNMVVLQDFYGKM